MEIIITVYLYLLGAAQFFRFFSADAEIGQAERGLFVEILAAMFWFIITPFILILPLVNMLADRRKGE